MINTVKTIFINNDVYRCVRCGVLRYIVDNPIPQLWINLDICPDHFKYQHRCEKCLVKILQLDAWIGDQYTFANKYPKLKCIKMLQLSGSIIYTYYSKKEMEYHGYSII